MSQYNQRHDHELQESRQSRSASRVTSSPEPVASTSRDDVSSVDLRSRRTTKRQTTIDNEDNTHQGKRRRASAYVNQRVNAHASCSTAVEQNRSGEDDINGVTSPLERMSFGAESTYKSSIGLKNSLHGTIYQVKLLMLFVNRGLGNGYDFRLAAEMSVAEKFDDVVFRYRTAKREGIVCRYLQAKHKQDESETISIGDLLNDKNGDFSLQKYFFFYRQIMNDPELIKFPLQDCVICTNINFDVSNKKKPKNSDLHFKITNERPQLSEICLKKIKNPDNFLDIKSSKQSARYRLSAHPSSKVFKILKNSGNSDRVKDEDIVEFFDKLVFAVNQPNEVELDTTITVEIGEHSNLNLLQADIVSDSFLKKMLDWFKAKGKEKGEEGRFFTSEEGRDFFDSMENKIYTLVCSGMSTAYREELENYGIKFEDDPKWTTFLDNHEQTLNLIADVETLPTAIRVCEAIRKRPKYNRDYGLIVMRLRTFLPERNKKLVIDSFKSSGKYDLLVIDCESPNDEDSKKLYKVYVRELQDIIDANNAKKIILIHTKQSGKSSFYSSETLDTASFIDLTMESKQRLLEKPIMSYQERQGKIDFRSLLGDQEFDYIVSEKLTNFGKAVDASTLVKLIRGDEIEVGTGSHALGNKVEFYVSRDVNPQILEEDIFTSQLKHDVFAIGNIDRETLRRLVGNDDRIQSMTELDKNELEPGKFFILDKMEEKVEFQNLCDEGPKGLNVHWIEYNEGRVIWKQSRGNIENLMKYKAVENRNYNTTPVECSIADHDLMSLNDKVVIISDPAGMGKTTLLRHLAENIIKEYPCLWVTTIDLKDFSEPLKARLEQKKARNSLNPDEVIEFVANNLSGLETALEKEIFKTSMKHHSRVVLLFDGFDEISPKYSRTVINLLRGMKDASGVQKLFVSTRPHMREALEEELGSFSYVMEPFSVRIQKGFLTKFWKDKFELDETSEGYSRLEIYADSVIRIVAKSINDQGNQLAGIPLQLKMLATIFQCDTGDRNKYFQTFENFLKSENPVPLMPTKMNVSSLYEQYCNELYGRYRGEKMKEALNVATEEESERAYTSFMKRHRRLAVYALFETADYDGTPQKKMDKYITEAREGKERVGIITGIVNNRPGFIHRSFAEYFVAKFLIEELLPNSNDQNEKTKKFIGTILLEPQHNVIRAFLNGLLLNSDHKMSVNQSLKSAIVEARLENGETVLHVGCCERHTGILKFVLNLDVDHEILRKLIGTTALNNGEMFRRDRKEYPSTAFCHAAHRGYLEGMKLIFEYDKDCLSRLAENESFPESVLPLYGAILGGHDDVVKWLLENGADANIGHISGDFPGTPLHLAVTQGNIRAVNLLLAKGARPDQELMNQYGEPNGTALYIAVSLLTTPNDLVLRIVEYLVNAGADPFAKIRTPKKRTNLMDSDDSYFQMLQKMITNDNIGSAGWSSALDMAVALSRYDVNEAVYLFLDGDKFSEKELETKKTLLCNAIWHATKNASPKTMEYLMNKLKAVDAMFHDQYSRNLLYYLVSQPHVRSVAVQSLIERANVGFTVTDELGQTMLFRLVSHTDTKGAWDVVCWLIESKRARLTDEADGGMKLVHKIIDLRRDVVRSANRLTHIEEQSWKILKALAESSPVGTNHETDKIFDNKILKFALENASLKDIQWLVDTYKTIDTTEKIVEENSDVYSSLRYALSIGRFDVMRWLAYKDGVDLETRDPKSRKTIQHAAAQAGYVDLLKWLFERGDATPETQKSRLNVRDNEGNTLLHASCTTADNLEMMKFLLREGHEVNASNKYGQTPLHLCCKHVDLEYVKCLSEQPAVNVNSRDNREWTPLHYSCLRANGRMEYFRLSNEDLVKTPDDERLTPFHYSDGVYTRSAPRETYLKSFKCPSPERPDNDGLASSNSPCEFRVNFEIVELLLSKEARVDATEKNDLTPLHCCCGIHKWLETYCRPNVGFFGRPSSRMPIAGAPYEDGLPPLHFRCDVRSHYVKGKLFLEFENDHTSLHYSCKIANILKVVKLLVSKHANYKARTNSGHTLLHIASKNRELDLKLAKYLVESLKLDVTAVDKDGKMAWEYRWCMECYCHRTEKMLHCDICLLLKPQDM